MFSRKVQGNGSRAGPRAAWMEAEHRVQARGLAAADEATSLRARLTDAAASHLRHTAIALARVRGVVYPVCEVCCFKQR